MSASYYIRKPGGRAQGPFAIEKIRGYIADGRVTQAMEYSTDGDWWLPGDRVPNLFPQAAAPAPARRRAAASERRGASKLEDPDERHAVNRAIATAHRNLRAMRNLFIADAFIVAVAFLIALSTDSATFKLVVGGLFVAIVLCTIFVTRFPLPCALVLAVFHSIVAAPPAIAGLKGGVTGTTGGIYVVLAMVAWGTVAMATNLQRLLGRYPDALAARRFRGEQIAGDTGTKWRDRTRADKAAERKKLALYVGLPVVLGIALVVAFGGSNSSRRGVPQSEIPKAPLQPKLDAFRTAWNTQGINEIKAFFARDLRGHKTRLLGKLFNRRDWRKTRPAIAFEKRDSVVAHQVAIFWTVAGEEKVMQTDWQWENQDWWLLDLKLRIRR